MCNYKVPKIVLTCNQDSDATTRESVGLFGVHFSLDTALHRGKPRITMAVKASGNNRDLCVQEGNPRNQQEEPVERTQQRTPRQVSGITFVSSVDRV